MKESRFEVFGDANLGRIFAPEGIPYESIKALLISPAHGRAVAIPVGEYEWLSVKGGGWNYGGPQIYISMKDEELIFGLYPFASAVRESEVSRKIEEISDRFPKVLYYKKLSEADLPAQYQFLQNIRFSNNEAVEPCLLYTELKCPFRVCDLIYLTQEERTRTIKYCCDYWKISPSEYLQTFTEELAKNVAILHKNGFINDTLDYGNVTMLSEVVDYEWVTAPGIKLFDGTYGLEITDERKEKEILYGAEICLQLSAMLHNEFSLYDIYGTFVEAYEKINPAFAESNARIRAILNREAFVL